MYFIINVILAVYVCFSIFVLFKFVNDEILAWLATLHCWLLLVQFFYIGDSGSFLMLSPIPVQPELPVRVSQSKQVKLLGEAAGRWLRPQYRAAGRALHSVLM